MDPRGKLKALQGVMFYVLYDLREDPSLSKIHLPAPDEEGPVLLLINRESYEDLYSELHEMNKNEGFEWLTSLIYRPLGSSPGSDLIEEASYILIAHMDYVGAELECFFDKLTTMRRWVPN